MVDSDIRPMISRLTISRLAATWLRANQAIMVYSSPLRGLAIGGLALVAWLALAFASAPAALTGQLAPGLFVADYVDQGARGDLSQRGKHQLITGLQTAANQRLLLVLPGNVDIPAGQGAIDVEIDIAALVDGGVGG